MKEWMVESTHIFNADIEKKLFCIHKYFCFVLYSCVGESDSASPCQAGTENPTPGASSDSSCTVSLVIIHLDYHFFKFVLLTARIHTS